MEDLILYPFGGNARVVTVLGNPEMNYQREEGITSFYGAGAKIREGIVVGNPAHTLRTISKG